MYAKILNVSSNILVLAVEKGENWGQLSLQCMQAYYIDCDEV